MKKFLLILVLFFPMITLAHGSGGTLEKVVGENLVDVGYSDAILRVGKASRFDFQLVKNSDKSDVDFNQVWVRIIKSGNLIFVGTLPRPDFGSAGMTFTFFEPGDYDMTVNYQKDGTKITETDFVVPVQALDQEKGTLEIFNENPFASFGIGIVAGLILTFGINKILGKNKT